MLAVCALAGGGCTVQATRDFALTQPWGEYERIVVHTSNGGVRLMCGQAQELCIEGRKHIHGTSFADAEAKLDALEVVARPDESEPRTLRVEVRIPEALSHLSPGANLTIRTPAPCAAEITASNGPIQVAGAKDQVTLETSNGCIVAEQVQGSVTAHSSNASIKLLDIQGDVTARTSNGSIRASAVTGDCRLHTSNAVIKVLGSAGNVQADTSNGSIHLEADPSEGAQIMLRTSNASISAILAKQLKGQLRLSTSNGAVRAGLLNVPVEIKYQDDHHLQATLNGGGPATITAETSNGTIEVNFR
jgi:DUF4097 and DUF4098 domain-containing protein YvlB